MNPHQTFVSVLPEQVARLESGIDPRCSSRCPLLLHFNGSGGPKRTAWEFIKGIPIGLGGVSSQKS